MPAEELVRKRVKDPGDFEWLKQCRFYWRDDKDTVIISICDRSFEYSFEYLGGLSSSLCVIVLSPGWLRLTLLSMENTGIHL